MITEEIIILGGGKESLIQTCKIVLDNFKNNPFVSCLCDAARNAGRTQQIKNFNHVFAFLDLMVLNKPEGKQLFDMYWPADEVAPREEFINKIINEIQTFKF